MEYKSLQVEDAGKLARLLVEVGLLKFSNPEALVQWKFFGEWLDGGELISYGAWDGERLVSCYSNKLVAVVKGENRYGAGVSLDMATARDYRRKGLISMLSKRVYEEVDKCGWEMSIGFSNESGVAVDKFAKGYGYVVVGEMVAYQKPVWRKKQAGGLRYRVVEGFSIEFDEVGYGDFYQIQSSYEYLKWRYMERPDGPYKNWELRENDLVVGYVVTIKRGMRLEWLRFSVSKDIDFGNILAVVNSIAWEEGCGWVVVRVLDNGFWKKELMSRRYVPFNWKRKKYYFTVKGHGGGLEGVVEKNCWLVMGGDVI